MGKNQLFFPQEALDRWLVNRVADLSGDQLWLRDPGQRFRLVEGVRVLTEVSGAEDPFDVCGTVRTVGYLLELGAELLGDSMIISENAYQIVPGWLGTPIVASLQLGLEPQNSPDPDQQLSLFLARNA
jgi:hypothetical protein